MQYQENRNWMEARGGSSNAVSTCSADVKRIEKVLAELGGPHTDLDTVLRQYSGGAQTLKVLKTRLCR